MNSSRGWRFAFLSMLVAIASCSSKSKDEEAPVDVAAPAQSAGSDQSAATPSRLDAKDLNAVVDLLVASTNDLPRAEFDPAALGKSLGNNPQQVFDWVRDRTWWAPYRGLLRGAQGVMLDRVGSSLDRSVLLGDLMRRNGHTVRLAHAQLSEAQAHELLAKVRPIPAQRRGAEATKPASEDHRRAIEALVPGASESLQAQEVYSKQLRDEASTLIRSQIDQLYAAVREAALRANSGDDAAVAALRDHWWIEYEADGAWTAMDVLLPDSRIGTTIATASSTSDWAKANDAPSIPKEDWHAVQIRVVVERYEGGKTSEFTVLETTLRPAEVLDKPITLGHMPKPWPEKIANLNDMENASLWVTEWMPYLKVGKDVVAQAAFTDRGELKANPLDPVGQLGGGGLLGGMDEALAGGIEDAESSATAEWIDYEVLVPGAASERLRRPVFDILGPAKRSASTADFDVNADALKVERAESLWSRTDILLQPCDFTEAFVADLGSASIVANAAALKEFSQERDHGKAKELAARILGNIDVWGVLPDLVMWRSTLGGQPNDWFIDRPNVLNYRVNGPQFDASGVTQRHMIDIASNSVGIRRGAGKGVFQARLEQGVVDTVAELITLSRDLRTAENTASVFALAGTTSQRSVLIGPKESSEANGLEWPDDPEARLKEDLDEGFMVVALKQPVSLNGQERVGWWRVDPGSGATIGVMDTGFHVAAGEKAAITSLIASLVAFLNKYPLPQAPPAADRAARLAWQTTYGGLQVLRDAAIQTLMNAMREGHCVPGWNC